MKPLIPVALMVAGVVFPACAQRGGSRGISMGGSIGQGGGLAVHSAPISRNSFSSVGRTSFMGAPQLRYGGPAADLRLNRGPISTGSNHRPVHREANRFRLPYVPFYGVGLGYGYPGYIGPGFLDYPDSAYNDSGYAAPQSSSTYPAVQNDAPPAEQADAIPANAYRPAYVKPYPEPEPEPAVTLIFKDGRPSEEIHNYMLTRTTVYVHDTRLREIPVDQLDLAATEKVNLDTGVDFQLPQAGK